MPPQAAQLQFLKPKISKTWVPLSLLFGEAFLFVFSGGVVAIVLSRWGGAELLGQYSLVLAWIALFQAIATFGLTEFTMRELGRVADRDGKYIMHSLLFGACSSAVCMVVMTGVVLLINYPENMREALLLGVLLLAPMTASGICRAGFLAQDRSEFVFAVALVESLTAVSINCYLAIAGYGIVSFVVTMLGVKVMTSLLSLHLLRQHMAIFRPVFDAKFCREFLSTLLPFALGNMLGTLSMRINLILLSIWATIPNVGLFAAASKVLDILLIIPAIFAQTLLSRLSCSFAQHKTWEIKEYLASSIRWMLGFVVVLGGGIAVFAPLLLKVLFGPEFVEAGDILRLLMLFLIIESVDTIMSVTFKAAGHEKLDVRLFMSNVVTNISASLLLIPALGGLGCAVAKLLGGLACSILRYAAMVMIAFQMDWSGIAAAKTHIRRFLDRVHLTVLILERYHACTYVFDIRVHRINYRFKKQWPADMLPFPPPKLIYLVTGQYKIEQFLANGMLGSKCIRGILAKNGLDIEAFQSILDFGCGCGRIMRHWSNLPHSRLYGTDYNHSLIEWCRHALPFAQFSVNPLHGPFEYKDGQFDFVYAISVLTHLNVTGQQIWMNELLRVLRPGGYLYLTVHGNHEDQLTSEEQNDFQAGRPVVFGERYVGSNFCAAFCPESYMRKVLAKNFTVLEVIPIGAQDARQDVYLLQKPHVSFI